MPHDRLPKLLGADVELGNFMLGDHGHDTAREASRRLLREIDAPYADANGWCLPADPQDWGRKFLPNGACAYVDLDHLEICVPEVVSAWDHVAAWHATLRIARDALRRAGARLRPGRTLHLLANNSDGMGHAYGSHVSVLLARAAWDGLFERRLHHLLVLAAFQASSIVYTGQGKVGSENGRPAVAYQLSQRADFFETLVGPQTTHRRPLVNSRDEPLCGGDGTRARLHCIFFDNTLCHVSTLLKVGTMQLVVAMIEAGAVDVRCALDDPVAAVLAWSHDPTLTARARTVTGTEVTAVELQLMFVEAARRFAETGGFEGVVPRFDELLTLWDDTLQKLRAGEWITLTGRIDWLLKLHILQRALVARPGLDWRAPELKHLDHMYGSVDDADGLFWAWERLGAVEPVVAEEHVARFVDEPPEDTRAWTRGTLLRRAGSDGVLDVDWDRMRFWPSLRILRLDDPLGFTRSAVEPAVRDMGSLDEILDALEQMGGHDAILRP
jgi:Pup amidohydrolase